MVSCMQGGSGGDSSNSSRPSKSGYNAREVDASEYEPQIVELPSPEVAEHGSSLEDKDGGDVDGSNSGSEDSSSDSGSSRSSSEEPETAEDKAPASNGGVESGGEEVESGELTEKERKELWVKKLGEMRERYLASMTEEERVEFFKRLEL